MSREFARVRYRALRRDTYARIRFGYQAPLTYERIWAKPGEIEKALRSRPPVVPSGTVLNGEWDRLTQPIRSVDHVRFCMEHFQDGLTWEETGAYEALLAEVSSSGRPVAGCRTIDDVVRRYQKLDKLFHVVRRERRLRTRAEIDPGAFRERGGIRLHVDRRNRPLFHVGGGCHRLGVAMSAGLPWIPAQLMYLHPQALRDWWPKYRPAPSTGL